MRSGQPMMVASRQGSGSDSAAGFRHSILSWPRNSASFASRLATVRRSSRSGLASSTAAVPPVAGDRSTSTASARSPHSSHCPSTQPYQFTCAKALVRPTPVENFGRGALSRRAAKPAVRG